MGLEPQRQVRVNALIPAPPQAPIDAMTKMASHTPPQAKSAGIESAHKHHALDHNTSYFNFDDSGNFWSRKPDSVFSLLSLQKKS